MESAAVPMLLSAITSVLQKSEEVENKNDAQLPPDELSRQISSNGVAMLKEKIPGVKFVVQTLLIPKSQESVGLSMSTAAVWEPSKDFTFNVRWENNEILAIVSAVAISV